MKKKIYTVSIEGFRWDENLVVRATSIAKVRDWVREEYPPEEADYDVVIERCSVLEVG
jgi:hypothetical protein